MRKTKRRHRWLALVMCLYLPMSVFPLSGKTYAAEQSSAQSNGYEDISELPMASAPVTGKGYTFDPDSGKLTVSTNEGTKNWHNDTNIPEPRQYSILSLEIQEGVTSIPSYAFGSCKNIQNVVFPQSLTEIGTGAFSSCSNLNEVVFSNAVSVIGEEAFAYCYGLNEVVFLEGLTDIGEGAFKYCNNIQSVTFSKSLKSIGAEAFERCTSLEELIFLGNQPPESIGSDAFDSILDTGGTVYYPEGAGRYYTKEWKTGTLRLDDQWKLAVLGTIFVPVRDIALSSASAIPIDTDLALTATVKPADASYQNIVWRIQDANGTGAEITGGNRFRATSSGAATVLATVENGAEITGGTPGNFTKEFVIAVKNPDATSLTVILNDENGGASLENNPMKAAVEAALTHSGADKSNITAIKLMGNAGSITGWSWKYLLNLFQDREWAAQTLDLSGMNSLSKVENEIDGYQEISRLTAVCFPEGIQTIGKRAFYNCSSLNDLTFLGDTPPAVETDAFQGVSPTGKVNYPGGAGAAYSDSWKHSTGLSGWALIDVVEAKEQYSIVKGRTYYFDLSGVAFPGEVHDSDTGHDDALPDKSLRYMPFTYAGTVSAYVLPESMDGIQSTAENTAQYVYDHSLFIADYSLVIKESGDEWPVSWNMLKDAGLIFGTLYADRGVDYTIRAPTTGGDSINDYTNEERGIPENNEWDAILNKCGQYYKDNVSGYIKNWAYHSAWGQDAGDPGTNTNGIRWARGYSTARYSGFSGPNNRLTGYNYRPVLEIPSTQDAAALKSMALNLNGGRLITDTEYQGTAIDDLNFVYVGESFTAPDGSDYVRPAQEAGTYFRWMDSSGKLYDPGESVPSSVTELKAIWSPPVSISKIEGVTVPVRGEAPVTEILETEQYTGTVAWSPDPGAAFAGDTEYTAVITLTPKTGYSLKDITADFFTVEGAVATNGAGSGVVSAKFPRTVPAPTLNVSAPVFEIIHYGGAPVASKPITISNTGSSDAVISSVTVDSSAFAVGGSGEIVPAGGSISTWTLHPVDGLDAGNYTTLITVTYNDGATAKDKVSFSVKLGVQAAPPAPKLESKTHDSVFLKPMAANANGAVVQYSRDGGFTWQDSPSFTGLSAKSAYTFTARYAAIKNYVTSPASPMLSVSTKPETISLSRPDTPQTGDTCSTLPWLLAMLTAMIGCCTLLVYKKQSEKV